MIHKPMTYSYDFNPRTPYGMRLNIFFCLFIYFYRFQSTHPLRHATRFLWLMHYQRKFQSTHPLRDATPAVMYHVAEHNYFNPRTPYGMRLSAGNTVGSGADISIHAPLTGCDRVSRIYPRIKKYFNPRTPYGMRP